MDSFATRSCVTSSEVSGHLWSSVSSVRPVSDRAQFREPVSDRAQFCETQVLVTLIGKDSHPNPSPGPNPSNDRK